MSRAATSGSIRRRFVTVGGRQVHYRRAGAGPPVVLLHESPLSSLSLVDLVEGISPRFTAIALDTPGYGLSDPLPLERPGIPDYADAVVETVEALGVRRFSLYGSHTGAEIALEVARRHPERVASAVLDGMPLFTDEESEEFLENYLPPLAPDEFGRHLLWVWNRYRDQHLFFPWYRRALDTRQDVDVPDARHLHDGAMDLLRAGDGYRVAYAAAFRYRGTEALEAISELRVPTAVVAREDDLLYGQLDRLPDGLPAGVSKEGLPRDREAWAKRLGDIWAENPAEDGSPAAPAVAPVTGRIVKDYVDTSRGQLLVRRRDDAPGRPLVMLHSSPGSAAMLEPLMQELAQRRPVLAFDTLGNGDSDASGWQEPWIGDYAGVVNEALDALGLEDVDLYGTHTGALISIEAAIARPERIGAVVLDGVTLWDEAFRDDLLARYTPSLSPRDDGTHLVSAWNFARDASFFWPHYNRTREGIRWVEPPETGALHARVLELLKSCETYQVAYLAALAYPTRERLPLLTNSALILSAQGDMLDPYTDEAASLAQDAVARRVPAGGTAAAIEEFLSDAPQPARP